MWQRTFPKSDVEAGARPLYPMMLENPQLRWAFIRKIYSIVAVQLLLTIAVAAVVVTLLCPLYYYHQRHPVNYLLLGVFTVSLAFVVGLTCAFTSGLESGTTHEPSPTLCCVYTHEKGKVILESVILTTVVVVSLTLYTFWAAKRGYDFNFLGPFLFGAILVLMVFALIQILFPLGRLSVMIYGLLASLIFCGYIIYDTDNLIKRYSYDEYIWAAVSLYLDVINLFLALLTVFRAADT
uniref:Protein LIFEGUARD 4 n=1 Tax=Vitis vinifera TaxID=29760 RepID=A5BJ66_VITVI|nr:hypothetical protein VITISV_035442 [Vitis vinifera]